MNNKETDKKVLYVPPVISEKDERDQYKCESIMEMLELFGAPTSTGDCITQVDRLLHVRTLIKIHEGVSKHGVCFKALRRKGYTPRQAASTVFRELAARNHLFINEDIEPKRESSDPATSLAIAMVEGLTGEKTPDNRLNSIKRMILKSKLRRISEKVKVKSLTLDKTDGDNED